MSRQTSSTLALLLSVLTVAACGKAPEPTSYLYVWAGDSAGQASDFLGVIDADPASPRYGSIVASVPTGVAGTEPHHTEDFVAANGHLLANGHRAGRTWLFDLTTPDAPLVDTSFGDVGGFGQRHDSAGGIYGFAEPSTARGEGRVARCRRASFPA